MSPSVDDDSYKKAEGEFLSVVSHELRTPLSITKWYTEMLLDGDCGELTQEQKKHLLTIEASNTRAIDLIRSILNVSRLSLGTFSVNPTTTNLSHIVKQAIADLEKDRSRRNITIHEEYRGAVSGLVCDLDIDKQIGLILVRNVLKNAIAFSEEGKEVFVSVVEHNQGEVISGYTLPEDSLILSVKDSGIGIVESEKEKIFTKFFKGSNGGETDGTGGGLGLYLNALIIEKVGGHIWYESTQHSGSIFYIAFPKHGMQRREGRVTLD